MGETKRLVKGDESQEDDDDDDYGEEKWIIGGKQKGG